MVLTVSDPSRHDCARVSELLGRIADRWTLPVVIALRPAPLRFNQIRRAIPRVSQQMLTRTLRALERDGMVCRTVFPTVPPQVEYSLTPLGDSLAQEGLQLGAWAETHLAQIDEHRTRFDSTAVGRRA